MQRNIYRIIFSTGAAAAAAGFILLYCSRANAASTQSYTPARFALLASEINVASLSSGISNTRKVLIRADTATGQCWILELKVSGNADFRVMRAQWKPVQFAPAAPEE